jgi:hypothetical protein
MAVTVSLPMISGSASYRISHIPVRFPTAAIGQQAPAKRKQRPPERFSALSVIAAQNTMALSVSGWTIGCER